MIVKRLLFLGFSALMTALVAMIVRRLTTFAYTRATGIPPPED